jgi:phosphatidylserine/phosphatidylglycerophosphate/cardiolipin synthase-like enzyme
MEGLYIHAKTMIVDGSAALIGSQNYTSTSLDKNRELGMIVEQPALVSRCLAIYERDWLRAVPAVPVPEDVPLGEAPLGEYDIEATFPHPGISRKLLRQKT